MKTVSAVVVNWNDKDAVTDCIRSLLAQEYPDLEIIVSDNGSTDGSIESIRQTFPQVVLVENGENLGFGTAVNRGLARARGDYFIFLNNDLVLKEDSITHLVRALERDEAVGAVIPKILYFGDRKTINSCGVDVHYTGMACPNRVDLPDDETLVPEETPCGGIFLLRRETFEAARGFDENLFLYHEDHDLSWKIRLLGKQLWTEPQAVMYHHYHFNKGTRKYFFSEKNRIILLLKNLNGKSLALISPALLLVEAAQIGHSLLNGWFTLKLKSYWEILGGLAQTLKSRRWIQRQRRVTDREITRLYQDALSISGVRHPLLDDFLSPLLAGYWKCIRRWI